MNTDNKAIIKELIDDLESYERKILHGEIDWPNLSYEGILFQISTLLKPGQSCILPKGIVEKAGGGSKALDVDFKSKIERNWDITLTKHWHTGQWIIRKNQSLHDHRKEPKDID